MCMVTESMSSRVSRHSRLPPTSPRTDLYMRTSDELKLVY